MHTVSNRPVARNITAQAALLNFEFCFQAGYYRAARSWWKIVHQLTFEARHAT